MAVGENWVVKNRRETRTSRTTNLREAGPELLCLRFVNMLAVVRSIYILVL